MNGKFRDLTGMEFGKLTVIERAENSKHKETRWLCKCSCEKGGVKIATTGSLLDGCSINCGCEKKQRPYEDLTGNVYGRLKVVKRADVQKRGIYWECECGCENHTKTIVRTIDLKNGMCKSCGCTRKETLSEINYKHGKCHDRIYGIYHGMINRCYNKNRDRYDNYGGRGIVVCNEWLDKETGFLAFYNWAMNNRYNEELTLDRINVDGNYEPSNCKWATWEEQSFNKKSTIFITLEGETHTIKEWSKISGIDEQKLRNRHRYNPKITKSDFLRELYGDSNDK